MTRYRRASELVVYWRSTGPVAFSCRSGTRSPITGHILEFINTLPDWQSVAEIARRDPTLGAARDVKALLEALAERGLVERRSGRADEWPWNDWSPEAAFFHFGTRNPTMRPRLDHERALAAKARHSPPPPPTKSMRGQRTSLPPNAVSGAVARALLTRRTWRQFSARPLLLDDIASLLQLTFGVQIRERVKGQGHLVRKTSPSGGARHSIEAYLLALNVKGLEPGAYHYDADKHQLVDLKSRVGSDALAYALADQDYFVSAGALVVMSAVFERAMWRYPFNRAYRSVLTEAGHLGQTFCLLATAMNLAPFCTMAFRDRELEKLIGVDGVSESAMYVVGVGTRPRRVIAHPGKIAMSD